MEDNKLIAEFMGVFYDGQGEWYKENPSELLYNESWDWIMPVIEKIETTSTSIYYAFTFDIKRNHCAIYCHEKGRMDGIIYQTPYGTGETKIKAVYDGVVFFINWYNENDNKSRTKKTEKSV